MVALAKDKLNDLERMWLRWRLGTDRKKGSKINWRSDVQEELDEKAGKALRDRIEALRVVVFKDQKIWSVVATGR